MSSFYWLRWGLVNIFKWAGLKILQIFTSLVVEIIDESSLCEIGSHELCAWGWLPAEIHLISVS
jgi:hypothetical protein